MLTPLFAGLGLGFSLIVAIGAQNLFVLRQGMRREHLLPVVAVCAVSDAVLILLGVSGIGLVLQAVPWLIVVARWAGAAFLIGYGVFAVRRAMRPSGETLRATAASPAAPDADATSIRSGSTAGARTVGTGTAVGTPTTAATRTSLAAALLTCLALTWLNPHVYLDTVFLLGSVASTHGDGRWSFAIGACIASVVWFSALGFGARSLGRWLDTPRAWRVLDAVIAVVMFAIALSLVLPH
ncbi:MULTISPECIES: LysE/ArgO family amino acid transporter [Microbacterium]|uniref:LysE/ArgO family amino acid transporter n=1 Tax=Microbacterium TaxID=33882 RepID=UPI002789C345|nr:MULTISPECIES: LysE/ArgO family amino acid transporter [Microbacterium]MDQ1084936.1 L-lysine exporter family protein LysE/ArgO [Microbacterium sp. SORGH_AS_0344]MDQ1169787.1 L-lysine exporter family protein LysE/ArgO [Microbacterium proteolyticum]